MKVAVGETSFALVGEAGQSTIINVKTVKQHPDYNSANIQNDISVLELESPVDMSSYPNIKPVCLPAQDSTFPNSQATVSGWGTLASGGVLPATLHKVGVTVFGDGDCGDMNQYMTPDMMCAGLVEGGKDACQGDSGGPLFLPDPANNNAQTLVGVVSWGFGCANPGQLGIYAEVSHFRSWLDAQLTGDTTCQPPSADPAETWVGCESGTTSAPGSTSAPTTPAPTTEPATTSSSGSGTCGNCVFPFTFSGRKHTTCTTIDGDSAPWCATEVDANGGFIGGKYEYCTDPSCPGISPPAINVAPENAVGSCCKYFISPSEVIFPNQHVVCLTP